MDIPVEEAAVGSVRPGGRDYGSQSSARPSRAIGHGRIETVPVASLILTDTPRTSGTDPEHVLRLAEVKEGLPPILVQRSTLRVLDGMHRVKAAMLRGDDTIPVQYFEGSDAESFVQSVQANVAHGLPLSASEREAATERIVRIYPDWSDRAIAAVAGLSPPTVAGIRRRSTENSSQLNRRVGRDGRRRPVDGAPGRKKAVDIMRERPEAPLRAVAQEAGVSLGTAHNIRAKLRSEAKADVDGPGQERKDTSRKKGASAPPGEATAGAAPRSAEAQQAQRQLLSSLRQDPSVRMTEKGRLLLQWLGILTLDAEGRQQFADSMPAHRLLSVAQLAQDCSATWRQLATELQRAVRRGP
ncbi:MULTISPECIES: ParB/RepB/Spo0J family partition protein [Streptomyces]|uniref:ParB N-terminal domain-containing protein n=3 Tax=Streptomyces rimosus TaxID=1927 RepID=A0A8A1V282_STRR1|nr:ParB/RepB/Spo0J family partition protein [Streptomyces rimosus]MYT47525.1 ParB N-terminal domain-containing protein [Streptomyces sp. SID5471]QGY70970.1 hypothetical protein V519_038360 [Streptomyces rimosus R6-500]QST86580.1 ParB N-terminal domain-containing protein [Streptomyces rimosus subsp. rimosus ATCC 10970]QTL84580.1 hypothetical protein FMM49_01130 [Streptomyces rimosus subsp. rimosus]QXV92199.1 ParB N-terminal domain-containing protein [Streptomyces rimosus]